MVCIKAPILVVSKYKRFQEVVTKMGDAVDSAWGSHIWNYMLHYYRIVNDKRSI